MALFTLPLPGQDPLRQRKKRLLVAASLALVLTSTTVALPGASAATALPSCRSLPDTAVHDRSIESVTARHNEGGTTHPAYCNVELVLHSGTTIRVGLPLNTVDGGEGGVTNGAWNGRIINLGGGGYAGFVPDITLALERGEVGSSTDTGHSPDWCNAVDARTSLPNSQLNCGLAGGGFVLDSQEKLQRDRVKNFITDSIVAQTQWTLALTKTYYGQAQTYNYWLGASTGGRQGWEMAQEQPQLFDGILAGMPAMNWNRFIIGEAWPAVVVKDLLGSTGLDPLASKAANAAAVTACDSLDGSKDNVIAEPRRCHFSAQALVCPRAVADDGACLTETEARVIDLIWDGPRTTTGDRLWGGVTRGTSFDVLLPGGNSMSPMIETYVENWIYEDPDFDWRSTLTMGNFEENFKRAHRKFEELAATDDTNLAKLMRSDTKVITWHGTNDPLITSFGSHNYAQRLFDRYGVEHTRDFVRTFYFPGVGHQYPNLNASRSAEHQMMDALQRWVEDRQAPAFFDQSLPNGTDRKSCAYPDVLTTTADGSSCVTANSVPEDLARESRTSLDIR